jgi:anthranilate phosphoribosyltransferase
MDEGLKPFLARLARGEVLSEAEAEAAFGLIMAGAATPAQIAGLLMAMRVRGERVSELRGAARAMRARMRRVPAPPEAIDVCGTGGDGQGTYNISTAVTLVLAALGVKVAKHGNRALSSKSGGADVLAALGVEVDVPPERQALILERAGCMFLFAPTYHAALRHAAGPRSELGVRTIFNLLGPMANPAGVRRQLIGVFSPEWAEPMAEALAGLGAERLWIVHGQGLDELTLAGENLVVSLEEGTLRRFTLRAEDAGLAPAPLEAIRGGDAEVNAAALERLLAGERGAYRDTVLLNAAAGLIVAGLERDLARGVARAAAAIDEGRAAHVLARLREASRLA